MFASTGEEKKKRPQTPQSEVLKEANVFFSFGKFYFYPVTQSKSLCYILTSFFLKKYTVSQQQHIYRGLPQPLSLFSPRIFLLE